ncbi:MAG: hypothetical protein H6625_08580 [Bdellovibrionaceae bacterium]|nr:hypothetical protein [Pseudobdellovibrionaceae bacterium]
MFEKLQLKSLTLTIFVTAILSFGQNLNARNLEDKQTKPPSECEIILAKNSAILLKNKFLKESLINDYFFQLKEEYLKGVESPSFSEVLKGFANMDILSTTNTSLSDEGIKDFKRLRSQGQKLRGLMAIFDHRPVVDKYFDRFISLWGKIKDQLRQMEIADKSDIKLKANAMLAMQTKHNLNDVLNRFESTSADRILVRISKSVKRTMQLLNLSEKGKLTPLKFHEIRKELKKMHWLLEYISVKATTDFESKGILMERIQDLKKTADDLVTLMGVSHDNMIAQVYLRKLDYRKSTVYIENETYLTITDFVEQLRSFLDI